MRELDYFYKTKFVKMGKWPLLPNDSETWNGVVTSNQFKKLFGIPKGILVLHTLDDVYQHPYVPEHYFTDLHNAIRQITNNDIRGLEKKLNLFYSLVVRSREEVSKIAKINLKNISNAQLARIYIHNRNEAAKLSAFDQFAWIGEEYWTSILRNILEEKLKLAHGSEEYNTVLFALTKPEQISSTLTEKRAVIEQVIKIKRGNQSIDGASKLLAKKHVWMPVFVFGNPWTPEHYENELVFLLKQNIKKLEKEFFDLKNYSLTRNTVVTKLVSQHAIDSRDLQHFIDFGLTIDTRNEAEYFVSFAGFYYVPIVKEIGRRLAFTTNQVRTLSRQDIYDVLLGKKDAHSVLERKGKVIGIGYKKDGITRIDFTGAEAEKLFKHLESYVQNVQGNEEGKGVCASPGKVVGKARIVPTPEQNSKVLPGDILITYATTVDYLPAMKRAGAFVTEVGGLTCHAAVVAREFGVPCVVGFKNAMKKFKDGDLVEVDANNGVVKLLKSAK